MMDKKQGFCTNSRRWLVFMDLLMSYPKSCPYDAQCHRCGYFEERKPTEYVKRKMKFWQEAFQLGEKEKP